MVAEEKQKESTTTFNDFSRYPPIEKYHTIDGLLKSHAAEQNQKPLICYPISGVSDFEEHTAAAIDEYTNATVQFYIRNGLKPADPAKDKAPVVALLSPSNFEIVVTIFALNRLGWAVLFLSTRLTPSAYARLLGLAECHTLIVPQSHEYTVEEIRKERPACQSIPLIQRQDYRSGIPCSPFHRKEAVSVKEGKKMAFILHSSGTTGQPKPIFLTNTQCLANFRKSFGRRAVCTSPLFHSHGLMELFRAFYTRATMYLYNFSLPITAQNLMEALDVAKPELFSSVPYVLKLLAEKPEAIQKLAKAEIVLYAGSSCPDELGDRLVAAGVKLVANYGATETGQIMTSFRPNGDKEWSYMRLHRPIADHTLMDEIAPGIFECVGLDGLPSKGPSNAIPPFSEKNPPQSFRTADLFTRHPDPEKSNYFKYLSRLDDRITLVNGEKVLPIPIEGRIRQEELVREAVVFGFERSVPGVLVFRSDQHGLDLSDQSFLEAVWPAIEAANSNAETFSRIPRDLVVVKGSKIAYPRTDKGTCIRAQVYQQFVDDIDRVYANFELGHDGSTELCLDLAELQAWLLSRFRNELRVPLLNAEQDIFSAGVDSLQSMRLNRMIKKELDLGGHTLGQNVVFERGTVKSLAEHLHALRTGDETSDTEDELLTMDSLIEQYSGFTQHTAKISTMPEREVIVVTGATGNLGAFIVAELLHRPSVALVMALVRAPDLEAAKARVAHSLASRKIQITDEQRSKLTALPSDLSDKDLGLDYKIIENMLSSVTCIIHSAWAVNFNLGVNSFKTHVSGTHNLLNFCLRSYLPRPARFFFCSSVSTASGTPKPAIIPESIVENLDCAQATGYGRSKLVTEHIVRNAMRDTSMYSRVLRIGQLSGDSKNAIWNETEAVALMIRSALTVGALPSLDEQPSWLPVDVCAKVVADISTKSPNGAIEEDVDLVYHLVNPRTFSWKSALLPALQTRSSLSHFNIVSAQDWLSRLAKSEQDPAKNPSIKLIDFWWAKYGENNPSISSDKQSKALTFETDRTILDCPGLAEVNDPVSDGLIERYVDVWLRSWRNAA